MLAFPVPLLATLTELLARIGAIISRWVDNRLVVTGLVVGLLAPQLGIGRQPTCGCSRSGLHSFYPLFIKVLAFGRTPPRMGGLLKSS